MEEWKRHIANSRRVQRVLRWILAVGIVLALATQSLAVVAVVAITAGAGFWITQAHISDFEAKIRAARVTSPVGTRVDRSGG